MIIQTERLMLRKLGLTDAEAVFAYRSDVKVNRFLSKRPISVHEVETMITSEIAPVFNQVGTWFQMGLFDLKTNAICGDIGVHFIDTEQVELGYTLAASYQGKGLATEALSALIDMLFDELAKHRIIASIDPRNEPSIRLMERLGFRKEAHFHRSIFMHGEWTDDVIYAMLQSEWKKTNK